MTSGLISMPATSGRTWGGSVTDCSLVFFRLMLAPKPARGGSSVENTCSLLIGVGPKRTTTTHRTTKLEAMLCDGLANTSAQSALPATMADIATITLGGSPQIAENVSQPLAPAEPGERRDSSGEGDCWWRELAERSEERRVGKECRSRWSP